MPGQYRKQLRRWFPWIALTITLLFLAIPSMTRSQSNPGGAAPPAPTSSSYDQIAPVLLGKEKFEDVVAKDKADKDGVMARQQKLLEERYDLTPRPDPNLKMTRGKPIQVGPTARLPEGMTFEKLADMSSDELRDKGLFPKGFLPLPHPKHEVGGMVFHDMAGAHDDAVSRRALDREAPLGDLAQPQRIVQGKRVRHTRLIELRSNHPHIV